MASIDKIYWSYLITNNSKGQIISDGILVSVDFPYGLQAGLTEISLPRKHDTPDVMLDNTSQTNALGDEIEISVNGSKVFVGIIRSIYPSLSGTDQRVNLSVADYRARMNERLVEKDGLTIITWNENGEGTDTVKSIIEYIFDNGYVSGVTMPQATRDLLPSKNVGKVSIQDMRAGNAVDYILKKGGTYKWWVNEDKEFKVYEFGTGNIEIAEIGVDVISHSLRESLAEIVNNVWVIGAKKQYQIIREPLEPAWDRTLEDT